MFGAATACELEYRSYEQVAVGYGGAGLAITSDGADACATIREAQALAKAGKPVLLNVLIGKTDFREGSLSV